MIPDALFRLRDAGSGKTFSHGGSLNDPLGLTLNGRHLFTANGDDGNIIEFNTITGRRVDIDLVDASGGPLPGSGALFGLRTTTAESILSTMRPTRLTSYVELLQRSRAHCSKSRTVRV